MAIEQAKKQPREVAAFQSLRPVRVDAAATWGAQIGLNLLLPNGQVGTLAQLQALFGGGVVSDSGAISTTDDLEEGQFNLWFTDQRAQDAVGAILADSITIDFTYSTGSLTAILKDLADSGSGAALVKLTRDSKGRISGTSAATTSDLTEGANLYFTDERAQDAVGAAIANGTQHGITVTYDDAANAINFTIDPDEFGAKPPVAYAATAALPANIYSNGTAGVGATLTGSVNGPLVIDGVTLAVGALGERVLVAAEATGAHNGWYVVTQVGVLAVSPYILTRDTASDQADEIGPGYLTGVEAPDGLTGGSNNGKLFISVAPSPFVVGTDTVLFSAVGQTYTAGTGLDLSGFQFSIDTATQASLALADSAVQSVVAGSGISVDNTDPQNPVISATGSGSVPATRLISTTAPLTGGGDLTADRTLAISAATTGAAGSMSSADKTKLDGIATGATANATDAYLLARSNHTGTQAWSTLTGTPTTLAGYGITDAQALDATLTALAGANWAANALPIGSGADTVAQVSFAANTFPARASTGSLVAKTITDFGLSLVDDASASVARTTLGLGNVDNTSDASKPVSTAQAAVIALKQDASGLGTAAFVNTGNDTSGRIPTLDSPVTGQTSLTIIGPSARANLYLQSGNADAANIGEGTVSFAGTGSVSGGSEKRLALLFVNTDGTTANQRGGKFGINLKQNGSTSLVSRLNVGYLGHVEPGVDNVQTMGSSSLRWSVMYAGTGTINTSDAREKTEVTPLTDAEMAAAADLSRAIGTYQWLTAVQAKGADARMHTGLTVQRAIDIMQAHGLDPMSYGFICYDAWPELAEVIDPETGQITQPFRPAGDRYSFRQDELLLFMARGLDARLTALEAGA